MLLENIKAYTTSKNDVEVILNGEYTTNGKVLNGRQRYEDANGKVFWVPVSESETSTAVEIETVEESPEEKFFHSIKSTEVDQEKANAFFNSIASHQAQEEPTEQPEIYNAPQVQNSAGTWYTVSRGDTYESIAAEFGIPYSQIASSGSLYIGKRIRIK